MISVEQFDNFQAKIFVEYSELFYSDKNTTDLELIKWKFVNSQSNNSYHLTLKDDQGFIKGRAVLNERFLNVANIKYLLTQVSDLLVIGSDLKSFITIIKNYKILENVCVIHTSNLNSEKIYSKFFKFKELLSLSAFAFPVRLNNFFQNLNKLTIFKIIFGIFSFTICSIFYLINTFNDVRFQILDCQEISNDDFEYFSGNQNSLLKTSELFSWRFFDSPYKYEVFRIFESNVNIGFIVIRQARFNGLNFLIIMDFIPNQKLTFIKILKLKLKLVSLAFDYKVDALFGMFNAQNNIGRAFFKFPFFKVPDHFLPHRTPIFISSINTDLNLDGFNKMYFSLSDLDYF
jgi:hypothetical protein